MRPEKLTEIAMRYAPVGIKIRWKRRIRQSPGGRKNHLYPAHAHVAKKEMLAPRPVTREKLYVFLHECGHFQLRHFPKSWTRNKMLRTLYTREDALPRHVEEFEAEQFAIQTMRREGVAVPQAMIRGAKAYVKDCIRLDKRKARRSKAKMKIEPRVEEWVK